MDIQPDNTVRLTEQVSATNPLPFDMDRIRVLARHDGRLLRVWDGDRRPLRFEVAFTNGSAVVEAFLNSPVPPGGTVSVIIEGIKTDVVKPTSAPQVLEFQDELQAGAQATNVYRLPAGAELVTYPADLVCRTNAGRIELTLGRPLPSGVEAKVTFRYRRPSAPSESNLKP